MTLISFSPIQDGVTGVNGAATNTPLSTIYDDYNGNITDANISSTAAISGTKISLAGITNPYKFSAYLAGAANSGNGAFALVPFDTKVFDTGNNLDIVTHKGRFTAPIAGFYQFNYSVKTSQGTGSHYWSGVIYKNGTVFQKGSASWSSAAANISTGSELIQLAAGDYIEIFVFADTTLAIDNGDSTETRFSGFFLSAT